MQLVEQQSDVKRIADSVNTEFYQSVIKAYPPLAFLEHPVLDAKGWWKNEYS